MELTKTIGPAEVKCRCIVIPREKKGFFPPPNTRFDLVDGNITHQAILDRQFRLRAVSWFRQHRSLKAGDEVTFYKENSLIRISILRSFSKPQNESFTWMHDVLNAISDREINGTICLNDHGFSVEIGDHINETQIIVSNKRDEKL